jgi:hypothetical protein
LAAKALADPAKAEGGILLAGTVTKVAEKNGLHAVVLKMDSAAGTVVLLNDHDLGVKENDRILAAGSIIHEPAKNIAGYTGKQPYVIWMGELQKLP